MQCLQRGDRQMPITMRHVFAGEKFERLVSSMVDADGNLVFEPKRTGLIIIFK